MPASPFYRNHPILNSTAATVHQTRDIFYAVDFDRLIIHGERMTWEQWTSTGRRFYQNCEPMKAQDIERNPACFAGFTDLR